MSASRTKHSYRMTLTFVTAPPLRSSCVHLAHGDVFHAEHQHMQLASVTVIAKFGLHSHGHANVLVSPVSSCACSLTGETLPEHRIRFFIFRIRHSAATTLYMLVFRGRYLNLLGFELFNISNDIVKT